MQSFNKNAVITGWVIRIYTKWNTKKEYIKYRKVPQNRKNCKKKVKTVEFALYSEKPNASSIKRRPQRLNLADLPRENSFSTGEGWKKEFGLSTIDLQEAYVMYELGKKARKKKDFSPSQWKIEIIDLF